MMPRRPNPMSVKSNTTYDVSEAARALNVTPATIRNWIKDGLEAMTASKPHLILGQAIREYLRAKYVAARRPLNDDELFFPSCGTGRKPLDMQVNQSKLTAKTDLLKGVCLQCGSTTTRMISHKQRHAFAATFQITKERGRE